MNKMSETLQSTRQLFILQVLGESSEGLSISQIHKKVTFHLGDVSKRTIRRDIDQLSSEYNIQESYGCKPIRYVISKFNIKNLQLSVQDIYSLTLTRALLKEHVTDHTFFHASNILDSILKNSTQFDKEQLENMQNSFFIRKSTNTERNLDIQRVNKLFQAIKRQRAIKIEYYSFAKDTKTERIIHPYFFILQESKLHLIAYCNLRKEIRDFRVSRIAELKELQDLFQKDELAMNSYEARRFVHLSGGNAQTIKLQFSEEMARYIQEYESEKADELKLLEDGKLIFVKHTGITNEIVRWILSFGDDVIVIEPKELRYKIVESIQKMTNNYYESDTGCHFHNIE